MPALVKALNSVDLPGCWYSPPATLKAPVRLRERRCRADVDFGQALLERPDALLDHAAIGVRSEFHLATPVPHPTTLLPRDQSVNQTAGKVFGMVYTRLLQLIRAWRRPAPKIQGDQARAVQHLHTQMAFELRCCAGESAWSKMTRPPGKKRDEFLDFVCLARVERKSGVGGTLLGRPSPQVVTLILQAASSSSVGSNDESDRNRPRRERLGARTIVQPRPRRNRWRGS